MCAKSRMSRMMPKPEKDPSVTLPEGRKGQGVGQNTADRRAYLREPREEMELLTLPDDDVFLDDSELMRIIALSEQLKFAVPGQAKPKRRKLKWVEKAAPLENFRMLLDGPRRRGRVPVPWCDRPHSAARRRPPDK